MRRFVLAVVAALACASVAVAAPKAPSTCVVNGNTVTAAGLPSALLNFFVTDSSGKTGWVLGFTDASVNYTWTVYVPARTGATTYEFGSRTWGSNGSRYDVYSSCTAS